MRPPRQWYRIQALADGLVADVNIYDEIGPSFCGERTVSAQSFIAELDALPSSVKTLRVHVNSPGGDVFDALTIANRLRAQREEKGRTVEVLVEGVAASAATIITSAGSLIRVADNALMMVHNPKAGGRGSAAEMRTMADMLDTVRNSIIATYQWVSSKTAEELGAMLDAETWMDAATAVANGFAHEITAGLSVTASLRESSVARLGNIPEALRPQVEALIAQHEAPAEPEPEQSSPPEITREQLADENPELLEALIEEGRQAGLAEPITRADLDARASDLVEEIRCEGLALGRGEAIEQQVAKIRGEVASQAAIAERNRLQAIENMAHLGHRELTARAKYGAEGVEPLSPEAYAMAVLAAERQRKAAYREDAAADSADSFVPSATPPDRGTADAAYRNHLIKVGAEASSAGRRSK